MPRLLNGLLSDVQQMIFPNSQETKCQGCDICHLSNLLSCLIILINLIIRINLIILINLWLIIIRKAKIEVLLLASMQVGPFLI